LTLQLVQAPSRRFTCLSSSMEISVMSPIRVQKGLISSSAFELLLLILLLSFSLFKD
jgi:shikimate kinase